MSLTISFAELVERAAGHGLTVLGSTPRSTALAPSRKALKIWQERGYGGELSYMLKDPATYGDISRLLPSCESVVSFALTYEQTRAPVRPHGFGRVARYAWGRDYHRVIKKRLNTFITSLADHFGPKLETRAASDAIPLFERALAAAANIGFQGKNTMVIRPRVGSFFFLAELLWNVQVTGIPFASVRGGCGECHQCGEGCPTGALDTPYQLDARRCISYLTIEKRGTLTAEEREWIGEWMFGCDICQELCPFNAAPLKRGNAPSDPRFEANAGCGSLLNLREIIQIRTESEFLARFAGLPLMRTKREGLVRNALIVASNTGAAPLIPLITETLEHDQSEVVRAHGLWSLAKFAKLGEVSRTTVRRLAESRSADPSSAVQRARDEVLAHD